MAAAEDISLLSRNIKSSMGEVSGEFRKAAANSGAMSKIIKDLSSVLNAQRRDIAELSNTMSESAYEAEQTSSKMDHLSNLFREMISIQSNMQGVLRDISAGIRSVDNSIFSLNQNMSSGLTNGFSGLGTSLTGLGDNIISALKTLAIGAVGGALGAAGYDAVTSPSGGGGGGGGGGSTGPAVPFSGPNKPILDTIKMRESGNDYSKQNPSASASGAYQFIDSTWQSWARKAGVDVRQYPKAKLAPPEIQDKVADLYVSDILKRHGGDVTWIPREWYAGPDGQISASELQKNHGLTVDRYVSNWMSSFSKHSGGSQKVNEKSSTPSTAAATPQSMPMSSGATESSSGATPQSAPMATGSTGATTAPSGADTSRALNPESMAGHGHGPISGAMSTAEKTGGSTALPSGDIVALGRALEKMNIKVSEHPSFGGVSPTAHGRNSAHYDGMAIDINDPSSKGDEASDPVAGAKFDKLAKDLQAAGYTVLWRVRNHFNHIHAQLGGKGIKGGHSAIGGMAGHEHTTDKPSPSGATDVPTGGATPMTPPTPTTGMTPPAPAAVTGAAEPVAQAPVTPMPAGGGVDYSQMMSMMGGMGMGMGGIGGIVSSLAPLLMSAVQSSDIAQMQQPQTSNSAEMVQQLSRLAMNNQMVSETAVQQQAQQEISQEMSTQDQTGGTASPVAPGVRSMSGGESYAYNYPSDTSWPDWAGMIGGNHWSEMKNFKKNMWA